MNLSEDYEFEERVAIKMFMANKSEHQAVTEALIERDDGVPKQQDMFDE